MRKSISSVLLKAKLSLYLTYKTTPFVKQEKTGICFIQQKEFLNKPPYLTAPMFRVDVTWHWESSLQDFLGIIQWGLQQVLEVFIFRHVLVTSFLPLCNSLLTGKKLKSGRDVYKPPLFNWGFFRQ